MFDLLELLLRPGLLIGTILGVLAAVSIGKLFPAHDLWFFQLLLVAGGFAIGLVLELIKPGGHSAKN